mgnify:CR=1 FL=1
MSKQGKPVRKFKLWLIGIFVSLSALFSRKHRSEPFPIEPTYGYRPDIDSDEPQLDLYLLGVDRPEQGDIHHEVKIDTTGRVFFKIRGRWRLQSDIEEVHAYRLRTIDKMDAVSRQRAQDECI